MRLFVWVVLQHAAAVLASRSPTGKFVSIARIVEGDVCSGKKHYILNRKFVVEMDALGGDYGFAEVELLKEMKTMSKLKMTFHRCTGGVTPSLCEYYTTWSWTTAVCALALTKGMFWSPLVSSFKPPFQCPLRTGIYTLNASMDIGVFHTLMGPALYKYFWIGEVHLYDQDAELNICFNTTVQFHRVRLRPKN